MSLTINSPGEELPPFPAPTHGFGRGLQRPTTIKDALSRMPRYVPPPMNQFNVLYDKAPYDPNQPLKRAITCDGGESNVHPSGRRTFNGQELALLQGFLNTHQFAGTAGSIKKQIGNAVPSCFAKTLFEGIISSLRKSDRKARNYKPELVDLLDSDSD
jgi:DNA (cytosine-5)-methyltransferase 1